MKAALPQFPDSREADLSLRDIVREHLAGQPLEASEYNFTNIFSYRETYNFRLSLLNGNLIILKDADPLSAFSPIGRSAMPETLDELFGHLASRTAEPRLERVPESFIESHVRGSAKYTAKEAREHFDYLYLVSELSSLRGNRYHDKKNKINRFRKDHQYEYLTLSPALIEECIAFEDYWCEVKECGKYPGLERERCAILEMLNNFEALGIKGGAIRVNGKIAALTLGEKFLNDTMVIHIEKANPDIPGLYQVINQEFLLHEAQDCRYVNREQDLGLRGLRQSKMSYNPHGFIKKFTVFRKNI